MGQVTFAINGRSYRIGCADGEEARLRELARDVAARVDRLVMEFGQVGEARLLLMASLLASDELFDVRANLDVLVADAADRLHDAGAATRGDAGQAGPEADEAQALSEATEGDTAAGSPEAPPVADKSSARTSQPPGKHHAGKPHRGHRIEMPGKSRSA